MSNYEELLDALDPRQQVAFAALCGERALREVAKLQGSGWGADPRLRRALDVAWQYAAGEKLDLERDVRHILQEGAAVIQNMDGPDADELINCAASVVTCSLVSLFYPEQNAARASGESMIDLMTEMYEDCEEAAEAEEEWQSHTAAKVAHLNGTDLNRRLLDELPEYKRGLVADIYRPEDT